MRLTSPPSPTSEILLSVAELPGIARTENAFCDRYADAAPGEVIVYHVGLLGCDRDKLTSNLLPAARSDLDRVADRAWAMAAQGLVHLLQRRMSPGCFAYLAVVRPRSSGAMRRWAA